MNNSAVNSRTKALIRIDRVPAGRTPAIPLGKFCPTGIVTRPEMQETANLLANISVKTLMNIHGLDRGAAQQALNKALKSSMGKNTHR